jgi:hypothetical protein
MVIRAQAYTLEGVLAAILIVTAMVYGLQAIDTRAWQDSTAQETQVLSNRANDLLTVAGESGALRNATLCYRDGRRLNGNRGEPRSEFEAMLNTTFDSQADQYNLEFSYRNGSDQTETMLVSETDDEAVNQPPASAAVATTTVTLTDGMNRRTGGACTSIPVAISNDSGFYAPDVSSGSELYNVVEVRLVVW